MGKNNKNKNKEEEKAGTTVGEYIDALYSAFPKEEFLGDPSHHYLFTIPEEQADSLGYLPDSRGHRDDRVKLPAHPSHPSRGTWNGNEFQLTDLGMQSPNYTLFGLNDGGQDPQAVLTYKEGAVIPEITVTPNGNYVENPYDNIIMRQKAKDQGPYYVNIKNYPVVNAEDEGLSEYFMNHKDVAGMAIGGGANGIDGPRRIVMNPYSDVLKTDLQKEGLVRIEAVRHAMDEYNYKPSFELSEHQKNLQKTVFKDYTYGSNDEAFKQSIISRILVGDADDLQPTPEQEAEAARFIFNNDSTTANQKGNGGTLDTPKKWDDLSFQEKSEMMRIAIKNGVYSLPEIKQKYNEYADGGKIHIDESKKGTFTAAATKHGMGVQEFASKVMSNPEDYSPEMRKKAVFAKNAAKWHCYGGNLFGGGGYKPSEEIKKRISRWEGAAMDRDTIDPLSGKIAKKNASFDTVTKGFVSALPSDIRESVLSNQELADNLYSYAYNVGPGNFKKRVVPTLQKYYKGQASIEDIENSMWASGDKKLRGLQRRRAQERAGVRSALWDYQMGGLNTAINNPMPVFMQDPSQAYSNPLATYEAPVVPAIPEQPLVDAAIRDAYTPEKIAEEERKDRAVLLGSVLNNFNQSGEYSPFINAINVLTGRGYSRGGHLFEDGGDIEEERPPMVPFSQKEEVIITPDQEYNKYLNTLPDNQRFTPNEEYDSYLYWQLNGKPKDFKQAYDRGMFNYDYSDNGYHGNSIAYDDNGIGYFIKPKTHDTVKYELDWYNKSLVTEEGGHQRPMNKEEQAFHDDFKSKYDLINDPDRPNYYRYQPKAKAFGGHLYAGGGGIKKYVGALEDITYDADNMKFYEKATGKELGDSAILDEVIVNGRNSTKDYLTEANDNTSVYNIPHREYNQHLKDRAEQGAREAAIWREEHPNLSAWGEAAASVPLAVASVPLIAGGAEALAGTSAGQAASSGLLSLSNLAKGSTIAGAPAWAWADAGLTSAFGAHGVDELSKGNVTPEALLEVAPLGQLIKPAFNASKNALVQLKSLYNNYPIRNYNIDSILKSDFYNQVSKQYGKEFADDIAQKLTTKEFRQYLFGDNPRKAYKDANTHLNQMRFIEDVENAGGQLGGSGLLSRTGTVNRNGLMHDLDFFIPGSIADKTSPVLDALSSNPYTSPLTEDSRAFLFGTGMRTPRRPQIAMGGPEQGYINVPQERYGVAADMFIRDQMPSESEAVDIVLDAKRQFGRPKDIADIEAFKPYSEDNPVIDLNTGKGQWNPTLFNKGIFTEEGYPTIQLIETYPGSRVKVPATMNYKGEIKGFPQIQLERPSTAEITAENAASMTSNPIKDNILITPENYRIVSDAQWDEAYSKALDAGDMTEAERLEALHLKLKAPNNKVVDEAGNPLLVYRANRWGNHVPYTVFDKTKGGNYRGFYFGNKDAVVERYGEDNLRSFYLNSEKPFIEPNFNILQSGRESLPNNDGMIYAPEGIRNSDFEVKVFEPEQIKLAGPTYDDAGNIIPLSQRHDFSNPDIRYGLLPFGIGLTGLGLVNEE